METSAGYGTMPNPVMQQGQCVTNCSVDTFFTNYRKNRKSIGRYDDEYVFGNSGDNENYYIVMPREFAMRLPLKMDSTIGRSTVMSSGGMTPKIFTSLNNFPIACTKDKDLFVKIKNSLEHHFHHEIAQEHAIVLKRFLRELIARSLIFVGTPLTRVNPGQNMSASISVTVSGTVTVYNTGSRHIDAGQKVAWDVPDVIGSDASNVKIRGEPRGKRFIEIVPVPENGLDLVTSGVYMDPGKTLNALNYLMNGVTRSELKLDSNILHQSTIYNDYLKYFDKGGTTLSGSMQPTTMQSAIQMTMGIHSRIIGTALTTSSPGGSFDLLLQI